jgi:mono/diheme cytochrome c family protein
MIDHRFRMTILGGAFALLALGALVAGQAPTGNPEAAKLKNPVPSTPESIAAGKAAYESGCASCHGPDAKGDPPSTIPGVINPPDLTDDKWDHGSSDGEIFSSIKDGVPPRFKMEPWEGRISDTDIWNIVNYLKSLKSSSAF